MRILFIIIALCGAATPAWGQTMEYLQWQMQNDDRADAETNAFIAQQNQQIAVQNQFDEINMHLLDSRFEKVLDDSNKVNDPKTYFPE